MMQPIDQAEYVFPRNEDGDVIIGTWDGAEGRVELAFDDEDPYITLRLTSGEFDSFDSYYGTDDEGNLAGLLRRLEENPEWGYFAEYLPLKAMIEQAVALDAEIRAVGNRGGYVYLQHRPHLKGFIRDVTEFYDAEWRDQYAPALQSIEETWFYDNARRTHICSFTGSVEGWSIRERITWDEGTPEGMRDQADGQLEGNESIDYFGEPTPDWDGGVADDGTTRDLLLGELTYEDFMDGWQEHLRGNEEF